MRTWVKVWFGTLPSAVVKPSACLCVVSEGPLWLPSSSSQHAGTFEVHHSNCDGYWGSNAHRAGTQKVFFFLGGEFFIGLITTELSDLLLFLLPLMLQTSWTLFLIALLTASNKWSSVCSLTAFTPEGFKTVIFSLAATEWCLLNCNTLSDSWTVHPLLSPLRN